MQVTVQTQVLGAPNKGKKPDRGAGRHPDKGSGKRPPKREGKEPKEKKTGSRLFSGKNKAAPAEEVTPTGMPDLAVDDVDEVTDGMGPQPEAGSPLATLVEDADPVEDEPYIPELARSLGVDPSTVSDGDPSVQDSFTPAEGEEGPQKEFDPIPRTDPAIPEPQSVQEDTVGQDTTAQVEEDEVRDMPAAGEVQQAVDADGESDEDEDDMPPLDLGAKKQKMNLGARRSKRKDVSGEVVVDESPKRELGIKRQPKEKKEKALAKTKKARPERQPKVKKEMLEHQPKAKKGTRAKKQEPTVGQEAEELREQQPIEYVEPGVSLMVLAMGGSALFMAIAYVVSGFFF